MFHVDLQVYYQCDAVNILSVNILDGTTYE